ncbi:MAG: alpha/beta hydrolase [Dysgonamonadaceae bacterium]|jgi:proline iminopeptidase|nr:alpha/beta hydrolase [Dysgonamonadaceae bacterium]
MGKNILGLLILLLGLTSSCEKNKFDDPGVLVPLTVDENPSLSSISVNGTLLHAETFGNPDSTMLVMLHGGPGGDYRSLLKNKAFADNGYFVVFYDQRGSGLSQRHNSEVFTTQIFIDDLNAVIEYYRTSPSQKIALVGQSWGAMLATGYVNQYPEKIAGLILTEPGGFTWETTNEYIKRSQKLELFAEGTNDYVYLDQFLTGSDHRTLDYKAALGSAADQHVGNASIVPFWRKGAICSDASFQYVKSNSFDFTTNLNAYTTKVFFGYSELNTAYGKAHAELVSSAFPNVKLIEFKNTGHAIPYYGWNDYYITALNYLDEIL